MRLKAFFEDYEDIIQKMNLRTIWYMVLILTIIVFSPFFITSEFFTYDDNWYIYENDMVINFSWQSIIDRFFAPYGGQYSPLGELYNAILYSIFGKNATMFRVFSLIVHLLNVSLLFYILKNIFENRLLVIFVVLVFAIHPMQVETIGWLSVMFRNSVFFMFLGYICYQYFLENTSKKYWFILSVVCYLVACLFKEQAMLFPVGIVLLLMNKVKYQWNRKVVFEIFFWALLAGTYAFFYEKTLNAGVSSFAGQHISFLQKIEALSRAVIGYGYNFLLPLNLSFSYSYPLNQSEYYILIILIALLLLALGAYFGIKNRTFRFGFLWVFGFLSLSLVLSFTHLRDVYMADRYAYLAIIGLAILLFLILVKLRDSVLSKKMFLFTLIGFVVFCSILTFQRVPVFHSNGNLWANALEVNPANPYANNSLGYHYRTVNELDKAEMHYKRAIELDTTYFIAYNNLGYIYAKKKDYKKALYNFDKAISILPVYKSAYINRVTLYKETNKTELLLKDLNTLLTLFPDNLDYLRERAECYFKLKQYSKAVIDIEKFLKINPDDVHSNYLLGHSSLLLKDYDKANKYMDIAISKKNDNGKYFFVRSLCRFRVGRIPDAFADALKAKEKGIKIDPNYINGLLVMIKKNQKVNK